jgi:uncharacterized protein (TIGR02646 family)
MKMIRPPQPDWLRENYIKWGRKYKDNQDNGITEYKPVYQGIRVNKRLLPILRNATAKHCAFCDDTIKKGTIEHFRPKARDRHPLLAFFWKNLFPCCSDCQEVKNNDFDPQLLKPDSSSYLFLKYFRYDSFTGELKTNPKASPIETERARITIKIYGLNRPEYVEDRLDKFENYQDVEDIKRPYRFMFIR